VLLVCLGGQRANINSAGVHEVWRAKATDAVRGLITQSPYLETLIGKGPLRSKLKTACFHPFRSAQLLQERLRAFNMARATEQNLAIAEERPTAQNVAGWIAENRAHFQGPPGEAIWLGVSDIFRILDRQGDFPHSALFKHPHPLAVVSSALRMLMGRGVVQQRIIEAGRTGGLDDSSSQLQPELVYLVYQEGQTDFLNGPVALLGSRLDALFGSKQRITVNDVHVFLSEAAEQPGTDAGGLLKSERLVEFIESALALLAAHGQLLKVASLVGESLWVCGFAQESER